MFEPVHSLISPQNVVVLRAQVTPPSLTKDVVRSLHGKSRGQVTATRTAVLIWAPEFGGRNGFPPPEKNELVLSIKMGCT